MAHAATLLTQAQAANFRVLAGVRIVSIDGGDLALRWNLWRSHPRLSPIMTFHDLKEVLLHRREWKRACAICTR
jgi:hypothetical protein